MEPLAVVFRFRLRSILGRLGAEELDLGWASWLGWSQFIIANGDSGRLKSGKGGRGIGPASSLGRVDGGGAADTEDDEEAVL